MQTRILLGSVAVLTILAGSFAVGTFATSNETRPPLCQTWPGNCVTMTETMTVLVAVVPPFYDVYANNHMVKPCATYAEYQAIGTQYDHVAGMPPATGCHGVPNSP